VTGNSSHEPATPRREFPQHFHIDSAFDCAGDPALLHPPIKPPLDVAALEQNQETSIKKFDMRSPAGGDAAGHIVVGQVANTNTLVVRLTELLIRADAAQNSLCHRRSGGQLDVWVWVKVGVLFSAFLLRGFQALKSRLVAGFSGTASACF
jgi:hypothetical protein